MTTALLISTYNRPSALRLCLDSVLRQTLMPDEVVVCDDGSADETRRLLRSYADRFPVPLRHVWHPDDGFRLAEIRNKGIAATDADYIIQVDGDVVLSRHFVADHVAASKPGHYIKGTRIRLNAAATAAFEQTGKWPDFITPFSRALLKDREKAVRLPRFLAVPLSHRYHRTDTGLGVNLSFWRADLLAVNGYDENFTGWGGEDNDLEQRLQASGVRTFKLFRCGLVYHLWHPEKSNPHHAESMALIKSKIKAGRLRSERGIDRHKSL